MPAHALDEWHRVAASRDVAALPGLLADEVVFHSPVVHTPQAGPVITAVYLGAAIEVLGNGTFRYLREFRGDHGAVLEFEATIDGIHVNGVDMISWNDAGKIVEFKVMLRPLKAVNLVHQKMAALLVARAARGPAA
jgi:hypothetical protein